MNIAILLLYVAACCLTYFLWRITAPQPTEINLAELAHEMLSDLLKDFERTSFSLTTDLSKFNDTKYPTTAATTHHGNDQSIKNLLATTSINAQATTSQDREHIISLLRAEEAKLVSEREEVWYHCDKLGLLGDEALEKVEQLSRGRHSQAQIKAAGEVRNFLYRCWKDAVATRKRRELRLERIKLDIKALKKQVRN
jgi:hypothetical protein